MEVTLSEFESNPSVDNLRGLTPANFDHVLSHIFELAGYQVHKEGGSLHLSAENRTEAIAHVSYSTQYNVGPGPIEELEKACLEGRSQHGPRVFGVMITRTDYTDDVLKADHREPPLFLLNGDQLLRYRKFLMDYRLEGHSFPPLAPVVMPFVDGRRHVYAKPPNVLAVTNNRGGIGKSTTALNIAYGLAAKGKSVLAIDMDPQANFTEMLGGHVGALVSAHIGRYFVNSTPLSQLIQPTPYRNIMLIGAHPDMSKAVTHPAYWLYSHFDLAHLLRHESIVSHPFQGGTGFDWVVIDTPPDMGFYTQAAITAANYLLAPTFPSRFGQNGIEILIKTAQARRALTSSNNHGKFIGFVATRYRDTAAMNEDLKFLQYAIGQLVPKEAFADPKRQAFLPMMIPDTPKVVSVTRDLIKTTQSGQPFKVFEKEGMGKNEVGAAYQRLVEEVLKRANHN